MAFSVQELIDAGAHFGHRTARWNPKMSPFIHGRRNQIHILDLVQTVRGLATATHFLRELCSTGRQVVFVGTKRQIKNVVMSEAERCGMPYVNERWLGGTLTNFTTIRSRLKRLEQLEELEETGEIQNYKKKEQSSLMREKRRIRKNLHGIRELERVAGAVVVIDPKKEYIAVREANRLGIPIVAVLDTDCDPDLVDIAIPANDDAMKSVSLILRYLVDAVNEGKANRKEDAPVVEDEPVIEMKKRERTNQRRPQRRQQGRGGPGGGRAREGDAPPAGDAPAKPAESATPAESAPSEAAPVAESAPAPSSDAPAGGEPAAS